MQLCTGDVHCSAELQELARIWPRVSTGCGIDLLELMVDTETVVLAKTIKIPLGLHRGRDGSGIMVTLMDSCLVDVSRTHKRSRVTL